MGPEDPSNKKIPIIFFKAKSSEIAKHFQKCSTICGTPVQAILDQKNLTWLAGGVREGQNIAQNAPRFWLWSPLVAPKWVKDP